MFLFITGSLARQTVILKLLGNSPDSVCEWGGGGGGGHRQGYVYELATEEDADHKVSFYLPQVSMSETLRL